MIGLVTVLWLMIFFFAVIDMQRGWTRAVIATSSMVLSLFTINQFGPFLFDLLGHFEQEFSEGLWRREIFMLTGLHLFIGFLGYAGPAFAGSRLAGRLSIRDNVQDKFLALIVGAINGFLAVGTLISFLEYRLTQGGWQATAPQPYPFPAEVLMRTDQVNAISGYLPIPLLTGNPYILPILLVVIFLFVLAVML